jgi:hypothetical protein
MNISVDKRGEATSATTIAMRVDSLDWDSIALDLDSYGCATISGLFTPAECDELVALYVRDELYRSRVVMSRHGFGSGEYKYFCYPLPSTIENLRTSIYPHLVPTANRWNQAMHINDRYPAEHTNFIARCHDAGQLRPAPLILRYGPGDYNCLHQDLYGEHVFPIQAAVLLSAPDRDFTGGEFVMVEQRLRKESRAEVVSLYQGDAVIFTVNNRPVQGIRVSSHRASLRHGVSALRSGQRYMIGIIFHDAK